MLGGLVGALVAWLEGLDPVSRALAAGLLPALLTALGSLPVFFGVKLGDRFYAGGMGLAAGVMLVASFTSLLLPALDIGSPVVVVAGFLSGVGLVRLLDKLIPHFHIERGYEGPVAAQRIEKAWLIALAIIIHNIPEGLAIGSSVTYSLSDGIVLALAIGVQDIPEGLAVAIPVTAATGRPSRGFLVGLLSGVSEALAAVIPPVLIALTAALQPFLMALSAGAMVYVVIHEIAPDIYHEERRSEDATLGFIAGFVVMLLLDTLLG